MSDIETPKQKIVVHYDPATQRVVHIEANGFSLPLAGAILGMAQEELKFLNNLQKAQAAQQEALQANHLAQQVKHQLERKLQV